MVPPEALNESTPKPRAVKSRVDPLTILKFPPMLLPTTFATLSVPPFPMDALPESEPPDKTKLPPLMLV